MYEGNLTFADRSSNGTFWAKETRFQLVTGPNHPPSAPVLSNAVAGVIQVLEGTNLVGILDVPTDSDTNDTITPTLNIQGAYGGAQQDNYQFELSTNNGRVQLRLVSGNFAYTNQSQYRIKVRHEDTYGLYADTAFVLAVTHPQTITFNALTNKTYGDGAFDLEATSDSGLPVSYSSSDPNVAEVTGNRVTIKAAGSVTITATQAGGVNGWLAAQPVDQVLVVSPKSLTIGSPTIAPRDYNGTKTAGEVTVGSLDGLANGESLGTTTAAAENYSSPNVGTYSNVTVRYTLVNGTGANGGLASNYRLADGSATGEITAKELTVGLPVIAPREYDGTKTAGLVQVGPLIGFVSLETVSATAVAADYSSANVGTYSNVVVTYTLIDGTNGGLATNYRIADRTATGTSRPRSWEAGTLP